ncbi:MAG: SDR family NAD(P)-dependent oxidoreductase [Chloroflexi bacterium]|nr:SDR family NAD(P)-dependent oxidoreductase [Chloroflexota bacterium]
MSQVRFDGQVAVVTGAGGGLGREYAILLAERGAKVLVNDLGTDFLGKGSNPAMAQAVADEIKAAGGIAIANGDSVATTKGAETIIKQAVDAWGRVDILINNAGVVRSTGSLDQVTDEDYEFDMSVAAGGTFRMTRAVWRRMWDQDYGRVLNVSSASVFGMGSALSYPATKAAVLGMTRTLAVAVQHHKKNIKINCIMPSAYGRLAVFGGPRFEESMKKLPVHSCAPVVAWLVHRDVPCNGEILLIGGGHFARVFMGLCQGYHGSPDITIEEVREHFAEGMDITNFSIPASTFDPVVTWSVVDFSEFMDLVMR